MKPYQCNRKQEKKLIKSDSLKKLKISLKTISVKIINGKDSHIY